MANYPSTISRVESFKERLLRLLAEREMSVREFARLYAGSDAGLENARNKIQRWISPTGATVPQRNGVARAEKVLSLPPGHLEETIQRGRRAPDWRPEVEELWRVVRRLEEALDDPQQPQQPEGTP